MIIRSYGYSCEIEYEVFEISKGVWQVNYNGAAGPVSWVFSSNDVIKGLTKLLLELNPYDGDFILEIQE